MPLFKAYFLPEISGNEPLEVDLGLTSDAVTAFVDRIQKERSARLGGDVDVRVFHIIAMETFHFGKKIVVREGDIVWRVWWKDERLQMPPEDYRKLVEFYKPIWEPGPGWLEVRQEFFEDVILG